MARALPRTPWFELPVLLDERDGEDGLVGERSAVDGRDQVCCLRRDYGSPSEPTLQWCVEGRTCMMTFPGTSTTLWIVTWGWQISVHGPGGDSPALGVYLEPGERREQPFAPFDVLPRFFRQAHSCGHVINGLPQRGGIDRSGPHTVHNVIPDDGHSRRSPSR